MSTYTFLQAQELNQAIHDDIDEEYLKLLQSKHLNFLQMEQVRLAILEGLDKEIIKKMVSLNLSNKDMEDIIYRHKEKLPQDFSIYSSRQIKRNYAYLLIIPLFILFGISLYLFKSRQIIPILELKNSEINISCGDTFIPENYIKEYSSEYELVLPDTFSLDKPQAVLVEYKLITPNKELVQRMKINVIDDKEPVISLSQEEVNILSEYKPNCLDYLVSAIDDVDGDITNQVGCHYTEDPRELLYYVKDYAGNHTNKVVKVNVVDGIKEEKEEEKEVVIPTSKPIIAAKPKPTPQTQEIIYEEREEIDGAHDVVVDEYVYG